jgi:hypothetical protein
MAKVLALYYSFTGSTERVMLEVAHALRDAGHDVTLEPLRPVHPYPFPAPRAMLTTLLRQALTGAWPTLDLEPLSIERGHRYDLVLIGYQPWYMTPSVPTHSFLKGPQGELLEGAPVIGLMTCRAMYGRATRMFQQWVEARGGQVVEQRVFVDQDPKGTNFISLLYFLKHGHDPERGPLKHLLKPFGVGDAGLKQARAYGENLAARLSAGTLARDGQVKVLR